MSNTKVILGFDQGFSSIKVYAGVGEPFKIDTLISEVEDGGNILDFGGRRLNGRIYDFEGKKYIVGGGVKNSNISHYRDVGYLIKYAPVFLAAALDTLNDKYSIKKENILCVSAGLPLAYVENNHIAYRERLKNFTVNGDFHSFERVYVNHQGVGGYADFFYSWGKDIAENDERGFIWDIGENTMILIAYEGGALKKDGSRQYDGGGISGIYDLIRDKVAKRLGRDPEITDFRAIILGKPLKSFGKLIDFTDIVGAGVKLYLENTYNKVIDAYKSRFAICDRVILIGGGAYALSKYINDVDLGRKGLFSVAPESEYSNVRGYRLLTLKR